MEKLKKLFSFKTLSYVIIAFSIYHLGHYFAYAVDGLDYDSVEFFLICIPILIAKTILYLDKKS